jgi:hypothetical protein
LTVALTRVVTYTDDVTGEEITQVWTCTITVDGAGVELHLSPGSRQRLLDALAPFLHADSARPAHDRPTVTRLRGAARIRAWANAHGVSVPERGRIPRDVVTAYKQAQAVPTNAGMLAVNVDTAPGAS